MKKLKICLLPMIEARYFLILTLLIGLLILGFTTLFTSELTTEQTYSRHLNSKELYVIDYPNLETDDNFLKINYLGEGEEVYPVMIDNQFTLQNQLSDYEPTFELYEQLGSSTDRYDYVKLAPIYINHEVSLKQMPLPSLGITSIQYGNYPINSNQLLVGELPAIYLQDELKLKSKSELIGRTISLVIDEDVYEFQISGITTGGTDFYLSYENHFFDYEPTRYSYYRQFDTKADKEQYILDTITTQGIEYYDSKNYNYFSVRLKAVIIMSIIITIMYIIILMPKLIGLNNILTSYRKRRTMPLILIIPGLLLVLNIIGLFLIVYST